MHASRPVFLDDFDGPAGSPPDLDHWEIDQGAGKWGGDGQLQCYTDDPANVSLTGDGCLALTAVIADDRITSGRITTRGRHRFGYGLVEARIKLPAGDGLHPAFWLMGSDFPNEPWPTCGEVDVAETVCDATELHTAIHGPYAGETSLERWWSHTPTPLHVPVGAGWDETFHVYQLWREPGCLRFGVDGEWGGCHRVGDLPAGARWVFDQPMMVLLNVAVGGRWAGPPASGSGRWVMLIDWVRHLV